MRKETVALVGYSGHGIVVAEAALEQGLNLKYYTEVKHREANPFDLEYLGNERESNFSGWDAEVVFVLGIGDNKIRKKSADLISSKKKEILNVIHPLGSISKKIEIGYGNFISKGVLINPLVEIGDFCILNTGSIIEHECIIGNAVHIAPGAVLAGNVKVGDFSFIGANAVIKQGVQIGRNVIIGAGTVVLHDVKDNEKIVGNPGRVI